MSKASEWADKYRETRLRFVPAGEETTGPHHGKYTWGNSGWAEVADDGGLYVVRQHMSASVARRLAVWIIDTFGEQS